MTVIFEFIELLFLLLVHVSAIINIFFSYSTQYELKFITHAFIGIICTPKHSWWKLVCETFSWKDKENNTYVELSAIVQSSTHDACALACDIAVFRTYLPTNVHYTHSHIQHTHITYVSIHVTVTKKLLMITQRASYWVPVLNLATHRIGEWAAETILYVYVKPISLVGHQH